MQHRAASVTAVKEARPPQSQRSRQSFLLLKNQNDSSSKALAHLFLEQKHCWPVILFRRSRKLPRTSLYLSRTSSSSAEDLAPTLLATTPLLVNNRFSVLYFRVLLLPFYFSCTLTLSFLSHFLRADFSFPFPSPSFFDWRHKSPLAALEASA